ncbi:gamma-glutamylcyclotransferase [Methyloceanibacter sp.]|uniref:gamma-glutamylcyclotransferase n=1 Tax=Methyloceanibacter sp. TaxID=1965321 RepID=UPI002C7C292A|nr:gamma-glutamylcyclotransferase [Methyloceanibacter sp.]HML92514.1 gamma-glutamylcyclotransferase [Methyloceanibacter sp.]
MWLFGYGSLMWDGWEQRYDCIRRVHAKAPGHRRIFNKKSLERWGTYATPGLTLNLASHEYDDDPCRGIAFEFPDTRQAEIEDYLSVRETCTACDIAVALPEETVGARTYIYDGPRLIEHGLPLHERARMILSAEGAAGSSYAYIRNVRAHLESLGVADREVDTLWRAVLALKNGDKK